MDNLQLLTRLKEIQIQLHNHRLTRENISVIEDLVIEVADLIPKVRFPEGNLRDHPNLLRSYLYKNGGALQKTVIEYKKELKEGFSFNEKKHQNDIILSINGVISNVEGSL